MSLTIIIVTFKSEKLIEKCLSTINKKHPIILIENSNNKIFKKKIEKKFSNVKCYLTGTNLCFGKANNIGLKLARTKYVLLLNPDTFLYKDTIKILLDSAKKIKDFALLAPIINNNKDLNYGYFEIKKNKINKNFIQVDYIKGFAMFFNKKKFNKIKFFDENIFIYLEEIDLCRRILLENEKIYVVKNAKIKHLGGQSHDINFNLNMEISRNWHWMWSNFYYYKKHFGIFLAYKNTLPLFFKSFVKIFFYLFLSKEKFLVNRARFLGLFNAYMGKGSFFRPFVD